MNGCIPILQATADIGVYGAMHTKYTSLNLRTFDMLYGYMHA